MSSPSSAEPVVTDSGSLWLQNKEQLHRLFIIQNKTLAQVKDAMESEHGFPVLRLHDYEIALRETLKLRKNLKKQDWHSIGILMANRKMQGKESEVLWNNVLLAPKKVRKDVLRNRKMNQLCYRSRTGELPVGVVIRTPPGSPSRQLAIIGPPETFHLGSEQVSPASHVNIPGISQAGSMSWDVNAADPEPAEVEISRFRHLRKNIPFNRFMSEFLELAKSYPPLTTLSAERTWIPEPRLFGSNPSLDMMARATYHLSNRLQIDWTSDDNSWFLNWLSISADFAMLRSFFSIKTPTVCAAYEELCGLAVTLSKPTIARVLFEIRETVKNNSSMTADGVNFLAIAVQLRPKANEMLALAVRALESDARPLPESQMRSLFLSAAARRDIAIMRLLVNAVSCPDTCSDTCSDSQFISAFGWPFGWTFEYLALIIRQVCVWEPEECKDGATIADYIQLLIQGRILTTSLSPRCCYDDRPEVAIGKSQSVTIDELVMLCPPTKRRNLYSAILHWSNDHGSFVSKAGVFTTAVEGSESVQQYLQSCKHNDDFEVHATLQECLLFAASMNDIQTASAMLQLGVDPQVSLLSNNQELYHKGYSSWNPMIVAAASGSLETLQLLGKNVNLVSFLKSAPVYEVMRLGDLDKYRVATGRELGRLDNFKFRRVVTYNRRHKSDEAVENGIESDTGFCFDHEGNAWSRCFVFGKRRVETIAWIRTIAAAHGMKESLDKEIIAAAMFNDSKSQGMKDMHEAYHPCDVLMVDGLIDTNLDYHEGDMDLLQLSIRAQCSLKFVEFLLGKGFQVHSRAAGQSGNTMLHDALLSWSHDRSEIVQLLLRKGAEYTQCGEGLTVLEASLSGLQFSRAPWFLQRRDYVELFTHLFEAGAPVRDRPRSQGRPSSQGRPRSQGEEWRPLICRLIDAGAEDCLIIRVADAGAGLGERERGHSRCFRWIRRPLDAAIIDRRENLAEQLIRRGADVHAPADEHGSLTALQAACLVDCSLEFVKYLIEEQGANANETPAEIDGRTALQGAANNGSLSLAEFLLDNDADVNAVSAVSTYYGPPDRRRALDYASDMGRLDMVEFLLKAGGRSGTGGLDGAIGAAKAEGHFAVASLLLKWEKKHGRTI